MKLWVVVDSILDGRGSSHGLNLLKGNQVVFCKLCSSDFSCDRGITELKRHEKNKKHSNNNAKNNVEILRGNMTVSTQDSFKKAEDVNAKALKIKDAARVAEAKLSNLIATHNEVLSKVEVL